MRTGPIASVQIPQKKKRDGWGPGSGHKPDFLKRSGLAPMTAHVILSHVDVVKIWASLLNSTDEAIRLQALIYLTNRQQGMPRQRGDLNVNCASTNTVITVEYVDAKDGQPVPTSGKLPVEKLLAGFCRPSEPAPVAEIQSPPPPLLQPTDLAPTNWTTYNVSSSEPLLSRRRCPQR